MGLGTVINVVAVLVGGGLGILVGTRLPSGMRETAMQAIQTYRRLDERAVEIGRAK